MDVRHSLLVLSFGWKGWLFFWGGWARYVIPIISLTFWCRILAFRLSLSSLHHKMNPKQGPQNGCPKTLWRESKSNALEHLNSHWTCSQQKNENENELCKCGPLNNLRYLGLCCLSDWGVRQRSPDGTVPFVVYTFCFPWRAWCLMVRTEKHEFMRKTKENWMLMFHFGRDKFDLGSILGV